MVDVGGKPVVERTAVAEGRIVVSAAARRLVRQGATKKGNPLEIARIAGIQAAKRTADLIPLCHPLALSYIDVQVKEIRTGYRADGDRPPGGEDRRRDGSARPPSASRR